MQKVELRDLTARDQTFLTGMDAMQGAIFQWAEKKGFWNFSQPENQIGPDVFRISIEHKLVKTTKLMLIVSELAELMEGLRQEAGSGDLPQAGYTNEEEELADAVIRILDYAGAYQLRLAEAIIAKMAVNERRPYRHGKAF